LIKIRLNFGKLNITNVQMFNVVTEMTMIQNQRPRNREWHCYLLIRSLMLAMT